MIVESNCLDNDVTIAKKNYTHNNLDRIEEKREEEEESFINNYRYFI